MILRFVTSLVLAFSALAAQAAVDVNKASKAELEALPGVGPALSGRLIDARQANPFRDWNDLVERVNGVGPSKATRLSQAGLTVAGSAYSGAPKTERAERATTNAKPIALNRKAEGASTRAAKTGSDAKH